MSYTVAEVEELLGLMWDPDAVYGVQDPHSPDGDMPRAKGDPSHGNNLFAELADIRQGWARADLTLSERRSVLMTYGLCWTQEMVAAHEGVSQQAISLRKCKGVDKIVAYLNGTECESDPE